MTVRAVHTACTVPGHQAPFDTAKPASRGGTRPSQKPVRHPAFGVWKGKVTLLPDYDYTRPADPDWGRVYED